MHRNANWVRHSKVTALTQVADAIDDLETWLAAPLPGCSGACLSAWPIPHGNTGEGGEAQVRKEAIRIIQQPPAGSPNASCRLESMDNRLTYAALVQTADYIENGCQILATSGLGVPSK